MTTINEMAPLDVELIIARISEQAPVLKTVEGAAEAEEFITGRVRQMPAAFVVLLDEAGSRIAGSSGQHLQTGVTQIGVFLAIRSYRRDELGDDVRDDLRTILTAIRHALAGWNPDRANNHGPLVLRKSNLREVRDGVIYWREIYENETRWRNTPP